MSICISFYASKPSLPIELSEAKCITVLLSPTSVLNFSHVYAPFWEFFNYLSRSQDHPLAKQVTDLPTPDPAFHTAAPKQWESKNGFCIRKTILPVLHQPFWTTKLWIRHSTAAEKASTNDFFIEFRSQSSQNTNLIHRTVHFDWNKKGTKLVLTWTYLYPKLLRKSP